MRSVLQILHTPAVGSFKVNTRGLSYFFEKK